MTPGKSRRVVDVDVTGLTIKSVTPTPVDDGRIADSISIYRFHVEPGEGIELNTARATISIRVDPRIGVQPVVPELDPALSALIQPEGPWRDLLTDWQGRERLLGRSEGHHPTAVRDVVAALDAEGTPAARRAADVIQSLVWCYAIISNWQSHMSDYVSEVVNEARDSREGDQ